MKRKYVV